jgi:serine/threonine-protein kinase
MNAEPTPLATLQPLTPPSLERVVAKCLAKRPDNRWDTAHDLADELRWIAQAAPAAPAGARSRAKHWRTIGLASAVVVMAGLAIAGALWRFPSGPLPSPPVRRLSMTLPADVDLYVGTGPAAALLPDDSGVVFVGLRTGIRQMFVRPLDQFDATPLGSTASFPVTAFFTSPDGRSVAFASSSGGLKRVTLADGLVEGVAPEVDGRLGGAWGSDGRIVYTRRGELWQVSAGGGAAAQLTKLDLGRGELLHGWPAPIADGSVILFTVVTTGAGGSAHIEAVDVARGERRVVVESGRSPLYTSSGHLVFCRDGALLAMPFDAKRLMATGPPVRVLEGVQVDMYGAPLVALSAAGSLAYVAEGTNANRLVWVSRSGAEQQASDSSGLYTLPSIAPDGRRIAAAEGGDLCVLDPARAAMMRLTLGTSGANSWPTWTPDGNRLVFRTLTGLRWIDANGSGQSEAIAGTSVLDYPTSVSPDGSTLAFIRQTPITGGDVYLAALSGEPNLRPVLNGPAYEGGAQFSPDGRWLAYSSNESGEMEVYVRPFPSGDRKWLVSSGGGSQPRWTKHGSEIVYRNGKKMMAVGVSTHPQLTLSPPTLLFERRYAFGVGLTAPNYDVSQDGQRFIMIKADEGSAGLRLALNWSEELKAKVPTGGAK